MGRATLGPSNNIVISEKLEVGDSIVEESFDCCGDCDCSEKEVVYINNPVEVVKEIIQKEKEIVYVDRPVEVIKEVKVDIPVDRIKEVIKEIEVIRYLPGKEIEIIKEIDKPVFVDKLVFKKVIPAWIKIALALEALAILLLIIIK